MQKEANETTRLQCLREGCYGTLREFPFVMLSSPPIHQYECRSCKQKYQGRPLEQLSFHRSDVPFDWAEVYDVIYPILFRNKLNAD